MFHALPARRFCWAACCLIPAGLASAEVALEERVEFELPVLSVESPGLPPLQPGPFQQGPVEQAAYVARQHTGAYQDCYGPRYGWGGAVRVGYEDGFVLISDRQQSLNEEGAPYVLRINGWGQLRHAASSFEDPDDDLNQFQLKRARLIFSGSAFTPDFQYFLQLDGRSSSGDDMRLLDYFMTYDLGRHALGLERGELGVKAGKYKMPFTMARYLTGREFEFTDRSMASTFFDVNRSLAWGLYGTECVCGTPISWETALFNGLVTGGAETGSSGNLDDNFAVSGRVFAYPLGDWGRSELADFEHHERLAARLGAGFANTTINSRGRTEFDSVLVVDSGEQLSSLLTPLGVDQYRVSLWAVDASFKLRGWSMTYEHYFRLVDDFRGANVPSLFDHGMWLQMGKFVCPERLELIARWSRVSGSSGTLGLLNESADEVAGGFVWYALGQHAKFTMDVTHLNGAPINSSSLDIVPGNAGWLFRSQMQFAF